MTDGWCFMMWSNHLPPSAFSCPVLLYEERFERMPLHIAEEATLLFRRGSLRDLD